MTEPYGVTTLSELYKEWALTGMIANIGSRLIEVKAGHTFLDSQQAKSFRVFDVEALAIILDPQQ